jgi:hypothetical protein
MRIRPPNLCGRAHSRIEALQLLLQALETKRALQALWYATWRRTNHTHFKNQISELLLETQSLHAMECSLAIQSEYPQGYFGYSRGTKPAPYLERRPSATYAVLGVREDTLGYSGVLWGTRDAGGTDRHVAYTIQHAMPARAC